jgi:hypothetical protein
MAQPGAEPVDGPFQGWILEDREPSAALADGVVVMLAAGHHGLVASASLPHLDPLDEAL